MPEQATTKQARYAGNHEAHCPYLRILSHHGFGHHVIDLYGIYLCKNIFSVAVATKFIVNLNIPPWLGLSSPALPPT